MEPVPESKRMEEFRSSPVPVLRLFESSPAASRDADEEVLKSPIPHALRRSTEPTPSSPQSPRLPSPTLSYRPRNTSPYSRGHLRSKSSASALAPIVMSRAQSMPGMNAAGHLHMTPQRPESPLRSPNRIRTPRRPVDEVYPVLSVSARIPTDIPESFAAIYEDEETPRSSERSISPIISLAPHNTFPRSRRPASPLRNLSLPYATGSSSLATSSPVTSSPSYPTASRFNESLLTAYNFPNSFTSSSVPSTPSSVRSRSPSISSLETIPDSPDAEEAALEAERIAQLKAAADAVDGDEAALEAKRRASLDAAGGRGRTLGITYGARDKRKRWSVCGAERRGDLDLETIWED
jgi:hypothetical protein